MEVPVMKNEMIVSVCEISVITCVILLIAAAAMLIYIIVLRGSLKEISDGVEERVDNIRNTPITISSSDRYARELASKLNIEFDKLRMERLKLNTGEKELRTAVTNIAHDLRTPLTAISGYLQMLEEQEMNDTVRRYFNIITERCGTMRLLTEELFQYSVINSTAGDLKLIELDLNEELENALVSSYGILRQRGISPEIEICEKKVSRCLDRAAVQRIFSNILNNAAKYSDGDLRVSLSEDGTVTFTNKAGSLTEVELARLFDRFYTVDNARGSTGLGLSIARLLTAKMRGNVSAELKGGELSIIVFFPE